jgi:hypothetical protein
MLVNYSNGKIISCIRELMIVALLRSENQLLKRKDTKLTIPGMTKSVIFWDVRQRFRYQE